MAIIPIPKVGRPTKMTTETLNKLKQGYAYGLDDLTACLYAEIHPRTLYDYEKKHPEFAQVKEQFQRNPVLYASRVLFENLADKPELALKVLEKLFKKYHTKQDIDITVNSFENALESLKDKSNTPDIEN